MSEENQDVPSGDGDSESARHERTMQVVSDNLRLTKTVAELEAKLAEQKTTLQGVIDTLVANALRDEAKLAALQTSSEKSAGSAPDGSPMAETVNDAERSMWHRLCIKKDERIAELEVALNDHHAIICVRVGDDQCVLCGFPYFKSSGDGIGGGGRVDGAALPVKPSVTASDAHPAPEAPEGWNELEKYIKEDIESMVKDHPNEYDEGRINLLKGVLSKIKMFRPSGDGKGHGRLGADVKADAGEHATPPTIALAPETPEGLTKWNCKWNWMGRRTAYGLVCDMRCGDIVLKSEAVEKLERAMEVLEDTRKSNDHWLGKFREAEALSDTRRMMLEDSNGALKDYRERTVELEAEVKHLRTLVNMCVCGHPYQGHFTKGPPICRYHSCECRFFKSSGDGKGDDKRVSSPQEMSGPGNHRAYVGEPTPMARSPAPEASEGSMTTLPEGVSHRPCLNCGVNCIITVEGVIRVDWSKCFMLCETCKAIPHSALNDNCQEIIKRWGEGSASLIIETPPPGCSLSFTSPAAASVEKPEIYTAGPGAGLRKPPADIAGDHKHFFMPPGYTCPVCGLTEEQITGKKPTVRKAARQRMPLDGADSQALEGALQQVERELAEVKHGLDCYKSDLRQTERDCEEYVKRITELEAKLKAETAMKDHLSGQCDFWIARVQIIEARLAEAEKQACPHLIELDEPCKAPERIEALEAAAVIASKATAELSRLNLELGAKLKDEYQRGWNAAILDKIAYYGPIEAKLTAADSRYVETAHDLIRATNRISTLEQELAEAKEYAKYQERDRDDQSVMLARQLSLIAELQKKNSELIMQRDSADNRADETREMYDYVSDECERLRERVPKTEQELEAENDKLKMACSLEVVHELDRRAERIADLEGQLNLMSRQGAETVKAQIARIGDLGSKLAAANDGMDVAVKALNDQTKVRWAQDKRIAELEADRCLCFSCQTDCPDKTRFCKEHRCPGHAPTGGKNEPASELVYKAYYYIEPKLVGEDKKHRTREVAQWAGDRFWIMGSEWSYKLSEIAAIGPRIKEPSDEAYREIW